MFRHNCCGAPTVSGSLSPRLTEPMRLPATPARAGLIYNRVNTASHMQSTGMPTGDHSQTLLPAVQGAHMTNLTSRLLSPMRDRAQENTHANNRDHKQAQSSTAADNLPRHATNVHAVCPTTKPQLHPHTALARHSTCGSILTTQPPAGLPPPPPQHTHQTNKPCQAVASALCALLSPSDCDPWWCAERLALMSFTAALMASSAATHQQQQQESSVWRVG